MSYVCDICRKKRSIGASHKHKRGVAGKRWMDRVTASPREFRPNLQKRTVKVGGEEKQMKLCTKCIKRIKNFKAVGNFKNISLA